MSAGTFGHLRCTKVLWRTVPGPWWVLIVGLWNECQSKDVAKYAAEYVSLQLRGGGKSQPGDTSFGVLA